MNTATPDAAYQRYSLTTLSSGRIHGLCRTNDNLDHGVQTEDAEWPVSYTDYGSMAKHTGLSHVGISGIHVEVWLDGVKL